MAKSVIGDGLGFINTITTRVMVGAKGHEEEVLGLPEETIKQLADEFAQKLVSATKQAVKGTKKLLRFLRSVSVPAVSKFVAAEAFGEDNPAGLKFFFSGHFKARFFGKTELDVSAGELSIHELMRVSEDAPIRAELTPEFEKVDLAHFYEIFKSNTPGWFIAYIEDVDGIIWSVNGDHDEGSRGWNVGTGEITNPRLWNSTRQVVSHKRKS